MTSLGTLELRLLAGGGSTTLPNANVLALTCLVHDHGQRRRHGTTTLTITVRTVRVGERRSTRSMKRRSTPFETLVIWRFGGRPARPRRRRRRRSQERLTYSDPDLPVTVTGMRLATVAASTSSGQVETDVARAYGLLQVAANGGLHLHADAPVRRQAADL